MRKLLNKINLRSFALLFVIMYLTISLIGAQVELMTQRREYENVTEQKERLEIEIEETRGLLEEDEDSVYIERIAREKLGYAKPGEKVYVDIQSE